MTPNNVDLPTLTNRWIEFTNRIEDGAKQLQDHAYALGYERARLDAKPLHDELVEALRIAFCHVDHDTHGNDHALIALSSSAFFAAMTDSTQRELRMLANRMLTQTEARNGYQGSPVCLLLRSDAKKAMSLMTKSADFVDVLESSLRLQAEVAADANA